MKYLGRYWDRDTYFLALDENYEDQLPDSNWVCFAIANEKPDELVLSKFIRNCVKKDLFDFQGFGLFGGFLHMSFDLEIVKMEIDEQHPYIEISTSGSNETGFSNIFWGIFGVAYIPDRADFNNIKVICVSFDGKDYSEKLIDFINRFNQHWLPIDDERIRILENGNMDIELTRSEALVLFDFLSRINQEKRIDLFHDKAEEKLLWDLESILESKLVEPLQNNYLALVQEARKELMQDVGK